MSDLALDTRYRPVSIPKYRRASVPAGYQRAGQPEDLYDAALVTHRLEEAGGTLLALPSTGYSTKRFCQDWRQAALWRFTTAAGRVTPLLRGRTGMRCLGCGSAAVTERPERVPYPKFVDRVGVRGGKIGNDNVRL